MFDVANCSSRRCQAPLRSHWSPEALKGITVPASELITDLHASAEYRAHLVTVMAARAVAGS